MDRGALNLLRRILDFGALVATLLNFIICFRFFSLFLCGDAVHRFESMPTECATNPLQRALADAIIMMQPLDEIRILLACGAKVCTDTHLPPFECDRLFYDVFLIYFSPGTTLKNTQNEIRWTNLLHKDWRLCTTACGNGMPMLWNCYWFVEPI